MKTYSLVNTPGDLYLGYPSSAATLQAQIDRSSISGTVTDPSGAVVPGATVVVTNTRTSESVTLATGSDGSYTASLLHVGAHLVEATARGFKRPGKPVQLGLNQVARVDLQLKVGGAGEITQVTSEAPLVATETSSLGTLETGNRIVDLPLNGRLFTQLAWLGPGASRDRVPVSGSAVRPTTIVPASSWQSTVYGHLTTISFWMGWITTALGMAPSPSTPHPTPLENSASKRIP